MTLLFLLSMYTTIYYLSYLYRINKLLISMYQISLNKLIYNTKNHNLNIIIISINLIMISKNHIYKIVIFVIIVYRYTSFAYK